MFYKTEKSAIIEKIASLAYANEAAYERQTEMWQTILPFFCKIKNETEGMEKYDILSGAAIKSGRLKGAAAKE